MVGVPFRPVDGPPQKFALWQLYGDAEANLIPGSVVTSGPLTAGQWNYVPLPMPLQLSIGSVSGSGAAVYEAATGFSGGFPDTNSQFGAGDPHAAGITNGPLFAFSDQGASAPAPTSVGAFQGAFGTAGTDPSVNLPVQGSSSSNFWIDLQISDTPPTGYNGSYRLWPNYPTIFPTPNTIDTGEQTLGTQFSLSEPCTLNNVWIYSPSFAKALPASTQIWNAATQTLVSGTNLTASWSGPVASGWVANSYAARASSFPPGTTSRPYITAAARCFTWRIRGYFGTYMGSAGPAATDGISPMDRCPRLPRPNAFNPPGGNTCYFIGGTGPTYPNSWDTNDGGENRWVDVEVTPGTSSSSPSPSPSPSTSTTTPPPVVTNSRAFFTFFP